MKTMEKINRSEFAEILYGMAANFGDVIDEAMVRLWLSAFDADKLTIEQIRGAAMSILRTRKIAKMPTLAEFLEHIQGSADSKAHAQADLVINTLRRQGAYSKPSEFADPITNHLMQARWPWKAWGSSLQEDEVKWWRRDFVEAYKDLVRNPANLNGVMQIQGPGPSRVIKQLTERIGE
jgi:hypothetical protein